MGLITQYLAQHIENNHLKPISKKQINEICEILQIKDSLIESSVI